MHALDKPLKFEDCCLYFASHCADVTSLPEIQNTYKLFSVTNGVGVVRTFNNEYTVRGGEAFIAMPYEIFGINSAGESAIEINCVCFTSDMSKFNERMSSVKLNGSGSGDRVIRDKNISESIRCIVNELKEQKAYSGELVSLLCSQLMFYVMRCYEKKNPSDGVDDSGINLCTSIINYIDNRVYMIKNLSEVADALGYNYSYISNLFRKTLGITLNKYFLSKKMHEAEKLLVETKTSVSKIAQRLNYSSVYAFSKAFKEYFGDSPAYFRKKHK